MTRHSLCKAAYRTPGTRPDSKILFLNINVLDSTGAEPYRGDVYIEGERIIYVDSVPDMGSIQSDPKVRIIQGRGRTLMSGLGDAHTHFTWNEGDLRALGGLGVEEHTLATGAPASLRPEKTSILTQNSPAVLIMKGKSESS